MKALVINDTRSHYGFVIDVEQNRDGSCSYYDPVTELVYEARELQFQFERKSIDWSSFRREAAKDILAGLAASGLGVNLDLDPSFAVKLADELIKQLQEEKK